MTQKKMKMANEKEFYTKNTELPALKNSTLGPPLGLDITFLWLLHHWDGGKRKEVNYAQGPIKYM